MSVVSNLLGFSDASAADGTVCRPAMRQELHQGLRIILGSHGRLASEAEVLDFLRTAISRRIDTTAMWVAQRNGRLIWAVLPMVSPGRTMLLLCASGRPPQPAAAQLIEAVHRHYAEQGVHLSQALIEPGDTALRTHFQELGFRRIAELLYMSRPLGGDPGDVASGSVRWIPYRDDLEETFRQTILRTYDGSMDCPGLNGLRSMEDVMAGHRAAGEFDPRLWTLMVEDDRPLGVSLLAPQRHVDAMELVYFGLVPEARGCGLGDVAMRHVLHQAQRSGLSRLSLAVDAINEPAIRLYSRNGLTYIGSKHAMLRDLRTSAR